MGGTGGAVLGGIIVGELFGDGYAGPSGSAGMGGIRGMGGGFGGAGPASFGGEQTRRRMAGGGRF